MARPAEFNRIKALEAAMKLFWSQGYSATSLPELLASMGIARSSFYASFHTKRELFIECLELFGDRTLAMVEQDAGKVSARNLPRAFFESTMMDVSQRKVRQGCMMVNTVLELADVDSPLSDLATRKLQAIENAFARCFAQAQDSGALDRDRSPQQLASMVMTINLGLRVQSRRSRSREELEHLIENSLSMLGLAA